MIITLSYMHPADLDRDKSLPKRTIINPFTDIPLRSDSFPSRGDILMQEQTRQLRENNRIMSTYLKHADQKSHLETQQKDEEHKNTKKDYFRYDSKNAMIIFESKNIRVSTSTNHDAARLMSTIIQDAKKNWSKDEILEEWGYTLEEERSLPQQKVYQAAKKINVAFERKTQRENFLIFNLKEVRINPQYCYKE